mmetsp:Transcript_2951/g.5648  ORF Transcript_2951/g.5648 Transcript_2951/m.5648 type:complete len:216 (+) Transcript_2951:373-1020(+)
MGKGSKKDKKKSKADAGESKAEEAIAQDDEAKTEPEEPLALRRMRQNIKMAFSLFDKDGEGKVVLEEVGTIVRYLGQFPDEDDLVNSVLPAMQGDTPQVFVTFERFEQRMIAMLEQNEFPSEDQQVVLSAFRALDEENKGYVEAEHLQELMTQMGASFRPKEMESFLNVAKDSTTNRIYYEDYVMLYGNQVDTNKDMWRDTKLATEALVEANLAN